MQFQELTDKQWVTAYAGKGYDAKYIRNYLRCNGMNCCIPYKTNSKFIVPENQNEYSSPIERAGHGLQTNMMIIGMEFIISIRYLQNMC